MNAPNEHRYREDYFLSVAQSLGKCPRCAAKDGSPCVTRAGKRTYPHKGRMGKS